MRISIPTTLLLLFTIFSCQQGNQVNYKAPPEKESTEDKGYLIALLGTLMFPFL